MGEPPATMLETFHWFQGEGFNLIVEDLLDLPRERGIVAEGFRLLPRLVDPLLPVQSRAVWLLPTPDFRRLPNAAWPGAAARLPVGAGAPFGPPLPESAGRT